MSDNDLQKRIDISNMGMYLAKLDNVLQDVDRVAQVIKSRFGLARDSCLSLTLDFIRSSHDVRECARREKATGRETKSVWDYHFAGFREYARELGHERVADIILEGKYEKVELPGSIDSESTRF